MQNENPLLILFKNGYDVEILYGARSSLSPYQESSWNNKTIELKQMDVGDVNKMERMVSVLQTILFDVYTTKNCHWEK